MDHYDLAQAMSAPSSLNLAHVALDSKKILILMILLRRPDALAKVQFALVDESNEPGDSA